MTDAAPGFFAHSLRCIATRAALRDILSFVDATCTAEKIEPSDCFDVKLAVEEICTNIIEYGYADKPGPLEINLTADDHRYVITISDRATPFRPESAPAADLTSSWEEREIGGLGWHLVRNVVDTIDYTSFEGGNRLTLTKMRKALKAQEADHADIDSSRG
jgi:serine/threonine-protein kinase RsbW